MKATKKRCNYPETTRLLFCAFLLAAAGNSFAGDYAHFHFIGFSADGEYLVFEEYGIFTRGWKGDILHLMVVAGDLDNE